MSVVAAFQETNSMSIHQTGALVAFTGASLYAIVQSFIWTHFIQGYKHMESCAGKFIFWSRFVLSVLALAALVILLSSAPQMGASMPPYIVGERGGTTDDPPYTNSTAYHLAAISEWTMALLFFIYILSFSYDFWFLKSSILFDPF